MRSLPPMIRMRRELAPLTTPALQARDRMPPGRPAPTLRSRPMPWMPGRSQARLMLARMRPMLAQLKPKRPRKRRQPPATVHGIQEYRKGDLAAGHAYGQVGSFCRDITRDDSLDLPEHLRLMEAAAAFVRANPDAPAEAIPIHLRLRGGRGLPETGPREIVAWRVFAFTLMQLDRLDAEQAAPATASPADAAPPVAAAGDMALMPQPGGFAPTGFTPRR